MACPLTLSLYDRMHSFLHLMMSTYIATRMNHCMLSSSHKLLLFIILLCECMGEGQLSKYYADTQRTMTLKCTGMVAVHE